MTVKKHKFTLIVGHFTAVDTVVALNPYPYPYPYGILKRSSFLGTAKMLYD